MVDEDKPKADKPATDKPVEKPKVEEPKAEEPKPPVSGEEPVSSGAAPASGDVAEAGTDQHGRQLYNVTCASCGKQAQVPFKPSGDRPVYCRDCYMKQRKGETNRGMGRRPRR